MREIVIIKSARAQIMATALTRSNVQEPIWVQTVLIQALANLQNLTVNLK